MKQRKLISLLSAVTVAAAAVPALPAAAEPGSGDDTPIRIHHIEADSYFRSLETLGSGSESGLTLEQAETCRGFSANWQNVTPETETLFLAGKLTPMTVDFSALDVLDAHCTVETDLIGQDAFFGWRTRFAAPSGNDTEMTDCYLVEGCGTEQPELPVSAKIAAFSYNGAAYDAYLLERDQLAQSPVQSGEKWQTVQEYWLIRESGITPAENGEYWLNADLLALFGNLPEQLDMQPGQWCETAFFLDVKGGSGAAESAYLDICAPVSDGRSYAVIDETGATADGYRWSHWANQPFRGSLMTPGENGAFRCSWNNTPDTQFTMSKAFGSAVTCDTDHPVRYDYSLKLSGLGTAFAGVIGRFRYYQIPENTAADEIGKYLSDFCIIDAWTGNQTPDSVLPSIHPSTENRKIGEITVDGAVYDVYREWSVQVGIDGFVPAPAFYSIRRENLLTDPDAEISTGTDLAAHLEGYRSLGLEAGDLYEAGVFVEAGDTAAGGRVLGTAEITENAPDLNVRKAAQPLKQAVRGDANCDGRLDVSDAVLVARVVNEDRTAVITEQGIANGDADGQNGLNASDITYLLQLIAKKIKF